jgi:DNA replication protein DnaC
MADACPVCGGTGFQIRSADGGTTSAARCACSTPDPREALRRAAGIPRRYEHCTLEEFVHRGDKNLERAFSKVQEWIGRWPLVEDGLVFHGSPGTGKTHLAAALGLELVATKGARVRFYEQRDLLTDIQGTFGSSDAHSAPDGGPVVDRGDILAPALDAQILVLDDLGAGRATWWAHEVLHDIITHRYNHKLPLIITTNRPLEPEDLKDERLEKGEIRWRTLRGWLGDALLSRLYEMCRFVPFRGDDFRKKIKNAEFQY